MKTFYLDPEGSVSTISDLQNDIDSIKCIRETYPTVKDLLIDCTYLGIFNSRRDAKIYAQNEIDGFNELCMDETEQHAHMSGIVAESYVYDDCIANHS